MFPDPWWEHVEVEVMFRKRCGAMLREFRARIASITHTYIACDCPRSEIWRLKLDPNYKANRVDSQIAKDGNAVWGPVFRVADEVLSQTYEESSYTILKVPSAEADDCIAVCSEILVQQPDTSIHVITGDSDLYQLEKHSRITVWDRKGVPWRTRLKEVDPTHYIEAKCYAGDSSDGIPSVGVRIGPKTALGWVTGTKRWPSDSNKINKSRLELNRALILFSHIPETIRSQVERAVLNVD